jgi:hypothetical protein
MVKLMLAYMVIEKLISATTTIKLTVGGKRTDAESVKGRVAATEHRGRHLTSRKS